MVAEMDVLISLALASNYFVGPTCRPSIKDTTKLLNDEAHSPYLHAKELGHPVYLVKVEVGALFQMM